MKPVDSSPHGIVPAVGADDMHELLAQVYKMSGLDFRNYALPMLHRRIGLMLRLRDLLDVRDLAKRLADDPNTLSDLVSHFCVSVSAMYRDPDVFHFIRTGLLPMLKNKPFLRIWHAGCATGEEAYSFVIMLEEEGFHNKYLSYATDIDVEALTQGELGIIPTRKMKMYTRNYFLSGGAAPFSAYYHSDGETTTFDARLRRNLVFATHNLVSDAVFNSFDVIFCRNVLIYFNNELQDEVLDKLINSLSSNGILILGTHESLSFSRVSNELDTISREYQVYKKRDGRAPS